MKKHTRFISLIFAMIFALSMFSVAVFAEPAAPQTTYGVDEMYDFHYASPFASWCTPDKASNSFGDYLNMGKTSAMLRVFASTAPVDISSFETIEIDVLTNKETNFVVAYSDQDISKDTSEYTVKASFNNNGYAWTTIAIPVSSLNASVLTNGLTFIDVCTTYYDGASTTQGFGIKEVRFIEKPTHVHAYTEEVATDTFKASDATCQSKAKYFKSCSCGEKGTETFEYGELDMTNHTKDTFRYVANEDGKTHLKKTECCGTVVSANDAHSYDSGDKCVCGNENDEAGSPVAIIVIIAVVAVAGVGVVVIFLKKRR